MATAEETSRRHLTLACRWANALQLWLWSLFALAGTLTMIMGIAWGNAEGDTGTFRAAFFIILIAAIQVGLSACAASVSRHMLEHKKHEHRAKNRAPEQTDPSDGIDEHPPNAAHGDSHARIDTPHKTSNTKKGGEKMTTKQIIASRKTEEGITGVKTANGEELTETEAIQQIANGTTFVTVGTYVATVVEDDRGHLRTTGDETERNNLANLPDF